jgi:PKD repeat protein/rubrerythrin
MKIRNNKSKLALLALYAIYITLIILISTVYIAENEFRGKIDFDNYHYFLTFPNDGKIEHYDVVRTDSSKPGYIDLKYTKSSNRLEVETINVKELEIDCRSIAIEKNEEILGQNYYEDTNAYKQYFIDKGKFTVIVDADSEISITYIDVPYPYQVLVDDQPQIENFDFQYSDGQITTTVPAGHSDVIIDFVSERTNAPNARFIVNYEYLTPGSQLEFDGSVSSDDGYIEDYLWDFGDGVFDSGESVVHQFSSPGQYGVILTVRDNNGLMDTFRRIIYVKDDDNNNLPDDWEGLHDVTSPNGDEDNDQLTNINEYKHGTDPNNPDSDIDGVEDGIEIDKGTDPLDSSDYPDEGKKPSGDESSAGIIIAVIVIILIIIILLLYLVVFKPKKMREAKEKEFEDEFEDKLRRSSKGKIDGLKGRRKGKRPDIKKRMPPKREPPRRPKGLEDKLRKPSRPSSSRRGREKLHDLHHRMVDDDMHIPMMDEGLKLPKELEKKPSKEPPKKPPKSKVVYVFECPTCGARLEEDEDVCPACGEEFED